MNSNLKKTAVAAALVLGFASAGMAKDYDQIIQDGGNAVYMNGAPYPYSEYGQARQAQDARAMATTGRRAERLEQKAAARSQMQYPAEAPTVDGW